MAKTRQQNQSLFQPPQIDIPPHLFIIPFFWHESYWQKIKNKAKRIIPFLQAELAVFTDYAVLNRFLGYPFLWLILAFIKNINSKEIYFLGTAGSLNPRLNRPQLTNVIDISASSIFRFFGSRHQYDLKTLDNKEIKPVRGVSVDAIQRETADWLDKQSGIDIVEMELFPLCLYLKKSFTALVVISDQVTPTGVIPFKDPATLKREFIKGFELILGQIGH